jgi:hypothetical protein
MDSGVKRLRTKEWIAALATAALMMTGAGTAAAQTRLASIEGRIADETGGAMPGVTVTATSPALQRQVTEISGADGTYRLNELPIGEYRVTFELSGFRSYVREGIALTPGFVARLDATMSVGALEESVTVSGASPVVDVVTTRGGATISSEIIDSIPNSRNYQDLLNMTPGVAVTAPPQMGEVGFRALVGNIKTYGLTGQEQTQIEGLQMSSSAFPDFSTAEQVDIKTYGNTADVAQPGAVTDVIVKSGGNQFHGRAKEQYMNKALQASNLDDTLRAQGLRTGDGIRFYQDLAGDLGGRIVRDRLWFYGAFRDIRNERSLSGYSRTPGADNVYGTQDDDPGFPTAVQANQTAKFSYQASAANRVIGFWQRNWVDEPQAQAGRFVPYEATREVQWEPIQYKGEWQSTPSSKLFFNVNYGRTSEEINYIPTTTNRPGVYDRVTQYSTGAYSAISGSGTDDIYSSISKRHTLTSTLSAYPGNFLGSHQLKVGGRAWLENRRSVYDNRPSGNYRLVVDRGVPALVTVWNYPIIATDNLNEYALFAMDQWRIGPKVTVNLGLRWEKNHAFTPEQTKAPGQFLGAGNFAQQDVVKWNNVAPRAAIAWDMAGDGKTVVKATVGRYNHRITASGFVSTFNPVRPQAATFVWRDLNGNGDFTADETNLSLSGPDFVSITGATSNLVNPDLKQPYTNEATASFERDLGGETSVRLLYVYKQTNDAYELLNVLRPLSAWNIPVVRRDPGPDGLLNTADDAGAVTLYDYDASYRGASFVGNQYVTRTNSDRFQTIEGTFTKRPSERWNLITSFQATKNRRWIDAIAENPAEAFFPIDRTWEWFYKLAGGYLVPKGKVELSALYDVFSGLPGQRTYIFTRNDPDGGTPLAQANTLNVRLEPFGTRRGPIRHKLDLRVARTFQVIGSQRLRFELDALNMLNTNVAWGRGDVLGGSGINWQSGPSFGYATQIVAPRIMRLGVSYEF